MIRLTTVLLLFQFAILHAQNFDNYFENKTLRVDYYHTGTATTEVISLDQVYEEGVWAGSRRNLIDTLNLGKYLVKVFDVATNQYQISGVSALNDPSSDAELNLSDPPYHAQLVSVVLGGDNAVIFDGFGAPDSGGTIVIAGGAVTKTILLNADSGRATAQ